MALLSRNDFGLADSIFALFGVKGVYHSGGAAANVTLDNTYPSIVKYDPTGGNRDVTLDAEATSIGKVRLIINGADNAENLVCKDADANTIGTVNQNEAGLFYCDATSGWVLVCIFTIALS